MMILSGVGGTGASGLFTVNVVEVLVHYQSYQEHCDFPSRRGLLQRVIALEDEHKMGENHDDEGNKRDGVWCHGEGYESE